MAEQLSPADASSLQAERGPVNMAVGGLLVFEPGEGTAYDAVADRVAARLHLIPRYRQRLDKPPLGIANPVWVDDDAFDLHWHLRRASVGGRAELAAYVAREMSRRLDRSRRSEEHTSELQSQSNLVCRLLLEKKQPKPLDQRRHQ